MPTAAGPCTPIWTSRTGECRVGPPRHPAACDVRQRAPSLRLGDNVQGSESAQPGMTPQECADNIRTAPVPVDKPIPVRKGVLLCVMTDYSAARARGEQWRMILLSRSWRSVMTEPSPSKPMPGIFPADSVVFGGRSAGCRGGRRVGFPPSTTGASEMTSCGRLRAPGRAARRLRSHQPIGWDRRR